MWRETWIQLGYISVCKRRPPAFGITITSVHTSALTECVSFSWLFFFHPSGSITSLYWNKDWREKPLVNCDKHLVPLASLFYMTWMLKAWAPQCNGSINVAQLNYPPKIFALHLTPTQTDLSGDRRFHSEYKCAFLGLMTKTIQYPMYNRLYSHNLYNCTCIT